MSDQLILDILLGLIIALFVPIGLWRGAVKEGPVSAAILLGFALAGSWAVAWGDAIASRTGVSAATAQLIVAMTLLVASSLLGYAAGAALSLPRPGVLGRMTGAVLAAINGTVLLAVALGFVERYLNNPGAERVLAASNVAWFLLRQFGWVLLGSAATAAVFVVGGNLVRTASIDDRELPALDSVATSALPVRQRPARLPHEADDGKFEPSDREFDAATGTYRSDVPRALETVPVPPPEPVHRLNGGAHRPADNGNGAHALHGDDFRGEEWLRRASAMTRPNEGVDRDPAPPEPPGTHALDTPTVNGFDEGFGDRQWPSAPGNARAFDATRFPKAGDARCKRCRNVVGVLDVFCPHCGALLT